MLADVHGVSTELRLVEEQRSNNQLQVGQTHQFDERNRLKIWHLLPEPTAAKASNLLADDLVVFHK